MKEEKIISNKDQLNRIYMDLFGSLKIKEDIAKSKANQRR